MWGQIGMMNFNAFGIKVTMAAALVAGVTVIGSMSAQAAIITGQSITFTGDARLLDLSTPTITLDFLTVPVTAADTTATPGGQARAGVSSDIAPTSQFPIQDLVLGLVTGTTNNWKYENSTGLSWFTLSGTTYNLTKFDLFKTASNGFEAVIDGWFSPESLTTDYGSLSSQRRMATFDGTTFSAELTAGGARNSVPTPALLPGLVGLGAAAWRKRQSKLVAA
jgi:hypothetical protein